MSYYNPRTIQRGEDRVRYDERYVLNQATTADAYSAANTLSAPDRGAVRLDVFNNAIFYQLGRGYPNPTWLLEVYLPPARAYLERTFDAIRVRSAVSGKPAIVTIEALPK